MPETGQGYLTVNVRTAGGALPVEGAMITVKSIDGENSTVIAVLFSDPSGTTEYLSLPAPPRSRSLVPEGGAVNSLYTVEIVKEGYYRLISENVPVYDGVTSIQQADLVPIAEGRPIQYPYDLDRYVEDTTPDL